jgi:hypothetical protein
MKNFADAAFESDHAVASLPEPVSSAHVERLAVSIHRTANSSSELPLWNCGSCRGIDAVLSPGFSEQIVACRRSSCMIETMQQVLENSFRIAWDYLDATGELGDPDAAAEFLLDNIAIMIRRGERRPLLLSNLAIDAYRQTRARPGLALVS